MGTLISDQFPPLSTPLFPKSRSPLNLGSISKKNAFFRDSFHGEWGKPLSVLCSISTAPDPNPCNYGGWEDLELVDESIRFDNFDPFQNFLISIGVCDKKHALLFFLGFISALAVSRVRFSSMVVLPVSALVFVAGFSTGLTQAGVIEGLVNQIGRTGGEYKEFDEKFRDLGDFFSDLDAKMSNLKNEVEGAIDSKRLEMGSVNNFLEIIECVRSKTATTRKTIEGSSQYQGGKKLNQKPSRKKRERGIDGFDFIQYLGCLVEDHLIGLRLPKVNDSNKEKTPEKLNLMAENNPKIVGSVNGSIAGNEVEERSSLPLPDNNLRNPKVERSYTVSGKIVDTHEKSMELNEDIPVGQTASQVDAEKTSHYEGANYGSHMLSYDNDLKNLNKSSHLKTEQGSYEKIVFKQIYKGQTTQNNIFESADDGRRSAENMNFFTSESEEALEQTFEMHDRTYFSSHGSKSIKSKFEQMHTVGSKEATVKSEDRSVVDNQQEVRGAENGSVVSSSRIPDDEEFSQNMAEANKLLKRAREFMVSQADEETAATMLCKSARLLSTAVALKPMSLLAVGQLGNTYLLHGELKLKISRELRTLLLRSEYSTLNGKMQGLRFKNLETRVLKKENVASVLVDVCEECEGLLVEAGRTYRKALSIDGNDIRALYNWGLALSFRAQLIADIGPEAAFDADKVYMAAIEKFNAMMSKSNSYSPDALYRWGVALQYRSHLRPRNSRGKVKLLQQAKSLFEDVLCTESDNQQVREALSSCITELNSNGQW